VLFRRRGCDQEFADQVKRLKSEYRAEIPGLDRDGGVLEAFVLPAGAHPHPFGLNRLSRRHYEPFLGPRWPGRIRPGEPSQSRPSRVSFCLASTNPVSVRREVGVDHSFRTSAASASPSLRHIAGSPL